MSKPIEGGMSGISEQLSDLCKGSESLGAEIARRTTTTKSSQRGPALNCCPWNALARCAAGRSSVAQWFGPNPLTSLPGTPY
jgi:hypothetical protein